MLLISAISSLKYLAGVFPILAVGITIINLNFRK
jgi:hypothetical protein